MGEAKPLPRQVPQASRRIPLKRVLLREAAERRQIDASPDVLLFWDADSWCVVVCDIKAKETRRIPLGCVLEGIDL